jgi:hypothetical protein
MKSFPTSRYKRKKVQYYTDIIWQNKKAVYKVVELPSNDIVAVYEFQEDAEEMAENLNENKPFGDEELPRFFKDSINGDIH